MSTSGTRHIVLYPYEATNEHELSISEGQVVYVTEVLDKGWVRGRSGDQTGMFPASYVQLDEETSENPSNVISSPPMTTQSPQVGTITNGVDAAVVIEDFVAGGEGQLPLKKDDIVVVLRKFPTGWASGECNGRRGLFPQQNIKHLDGVELEQLNSALPTRTAPSMPSLPSPTTSTREKDKSKSKENRKSTRIRSTTIGSLMKPLEVDQDASTQNDEVGTPATVIFDYTPADKGQLSLIRGETIQVLDKLSGGWWKGRTEDGEVGFFPGSYVRELTQQQTTSQPSSNLTPRDSISSAPSAPNLGISGSTNLKRASTVSRPSLKKAVVIYAYAAKSSSELTLNVGDEVLVYPLKEGESSGWWTGALASAPSVVAHFPAAYVKLVDSARDDSSNSKESRSSSLASDSLKERASKRKSQPAQPKNKDSRVESPRTQPSAPPSKPPPSRPDPENGLSPDESTPAVSNGTSAQLSNSAVNMEELAAAKKNAEQAKQGLIKLQQQTKVAVDGMLQRLDKGEKERQKLETAMRGMAKALKESEEHRLRIEQQNKVLYQQLMDLQSKLAKESQARSSLEARLDRLEKL